MTTAHEAWARQYLTGPNAQARQDAIKAERDANADLRRALLDSTIGQALVAVGVAQHAKRRAIQVENTARRHLGMSELTTPAYLGIADWRNGVPSPDFLIRPLIRAVDEEAERIATEDTEEAGTAQERWIIEHADQLVDDHDQRKADAADDPVAKFLGSGARIDKTSVVKNGKTLELYTDLDHHRRSLLVDPDTGREYVPPAPEPKVDAPPAWTRTGNTGPVVSDTEPADWTT